MTQGQEYNAQSRSSKHKPVSSFTTKRCQTVPTVVITNISQNSSAPQLGINVRGVKTWMFPSKYFNLSKKEQSNLHLVKAQKVYQLE